MERKELVEEIIYFCVKYKIIKLPQERNMTRRSIERHLKYSWFVESLINTIIVKTKDYQDIDTGRLINLLIELEKIRLELEYKE